MHRSPCIVHRVMVGWQTYATGVHLPEVRLQMLLDDDDGKRVFCAECERGLEAERHVHRHRRGRRGMWMTVWHAGHCGSRPAKWALQSE